MEKDPAAEDGPTAKGAGETDPGEERDKESEPAGEDEEKARLLEGGEGLDPKPIGVAVAAPNRPAGIVVVAAGVGPVPP